jgi:hypothetical protein
MKTKNTTYQNFGDTAKAVPNGRLIAMNVYIKQTNKQKGLINNLTMHFILLEKQEQARHLWLMPAILATPETEIKRITVQSQPKQIVHKNRAGGVAQGFEFKPQYHTHKKR